MRTAILIALGLVISNPSIAQTHICQSAVDARLQKDGIALNRVISTDVTRDISSGEDGLLYGYMYWMKMKSCKKGHLIFNLNLDCEVFEVFTDGPCQIAGVPRC